MWACVPSCVSLRLWGDIPAIQYWAGPFWRWGGLIPCPSPPVLSGPWEYHAFLSLHEPLLRSAATLTCCSPSKLAPCLPAASPMLCRNFLSRNNPGCFLGIALTSFQEFPRCVVGVFQDIFPGIPSIDFYEFCRMLSRSSRFAFSEYSMMFSRKKSHIFSEFLRVLSRKIHVAFWELLRLLSRNLPLAFQDCSQVLSRNFTCCFLETSLMFSRHFPRNLPFIF